MNQLEGLFILVALPVGMLLCGYWLAAWLTERDPGERLAVALVAGLATLLAIVAAVNLFLPLRGVWAYACLAPVLPTLLWPRLRTGLVRDLAATARTLPRIVLGATAVFFLLLLLPVLRHPTALYYDGTSNQDSFFWIIGSEHLKRNTYLEPPEATALQPLTTSVSAIVGWKPLWGRMGAEGLLAMASSVVGLSPMKLYLYGTASLALLWFATGYLTLRTFINDAPTPVAGLGLVCLQPIFVFFFGNSNLPNLLGTLTGTVVIVGLERALRAGPGGGREFTAWSVLTALALHGLLCSYPEMIPFVLLPCALLWLRPWFTAGPRAAWRAALLTFGVALAGLALNPATTIRAYHGFIESFNFARADTVWANLFGPLEAAEYVPGLITLSIPGARELQVWLGWPLSALLVVLFGLLVRHSRDRFGLLAGLSSGAVLVAYTLVTDFSYGWQKSVQFCGIFVAILPPAMLDLLRRLPAGPAPARRVGRAAFGALAVFMAYAVIMNCGEIYKWSQRKVLSNDWFTLREHGRATLAKTPVLIDAATFRMAFFHSMWATYFLADSHLYFGARGKESGGYLRQSVVNEATHKIPPAAPILVGREWADAFDANSPRILTGTEYALLYQSNRVRDISGWFPLNGLPHHATGNLVIELTPHSHSVLHLEFGPRLANLLPTGEWETRRTVPGAPDLIFQTIGAPPWIMRIPLVAGQSNRVQIRLAEASGAYAKRVWESDPVTDGDRSGLYFVVRTVRIEDAP